MRKYSITADCYLPEFKISTGEMIQSITIGSSNRVDLKLTEKHNKSNVISIKKNFNVRSESEKQKEIMTAISDVENFLSWLSFLTLDSIRVIRWGEVTSKRVENGKMLATVGRKFNIPIDTPPNMESGEIITTSTYQPVRVINGIEDWISIDIPNELKTVFRWYRKGDISYFPEEKLIFWITSLETASGLISEDTEIVTKCECGKETKRRPSVNKQALIQYLEEKGISKRKTYDLIQKYRSKYAHGGSNSFNYFSKEINTVVDATRALVILFITHCIKQPKWGIVKESLTDYSHPVLGDITSMKDKITELENSNLHKKSKKK